MFGDIFGPITYGDIQCCICNKKIVLSGDFIPQNGYCPNCGQKFDVGLDNYKFPHFEYDKDGAIKKKEDK